MLQKNKNNKNLNMDKERDHPAKMTSCVYFYPNSYTQSTFACDYSGCRRPLIAFPPNQILHHP